MEENQPEIHVVCISEHWYKEGQEITAVLPGYNRIAAFCRENHIHGGVMIFANPNLQMTELKLNTECVEIEFEYTAAISRSIKTIILCLYRSPDGNLENFLEKFYNINDELATRFPKYRIIICGDFNIHFEKDLKRAIFEEISSSFQLQLTVEEPTRIRNGPPATLDNILIQNKNEIYMLLNKDFGISDHTGQIISLQCNEKIDTRPTSQEKRIFNNKNNKTFAYNLKNINWDIIYTKPEVNDAFEAFATLLDSCFKKSYPLKKVNSKKINKGWITKAIRTSCKNKRSLIMLKNHFPTSGFLKDYVKIYSNLLENIISLSKQRYFRSQIEDSNNKIKTTWNVIKTNIQKNPPQAKENLELQDKNETITDPKQVADIFAQFFETVAQKLTGNIISKKTHREFLRSIQPNQNNPFSFTDVDEDQVETITKKLKSKHSTGYDEIPITIIKDNIDILKKPLVHLINLSLGSRIFPDSYKIAKVKPLFKKGQKTSVENYRPVSLLPSISKILETVVKNQLTDYITQNSILSRNQFGFQKKKDTTQAIHNLLTNINHILDQRDHPLTIFCDLSKAFDCVDHAILLEKLKYYGVTNNWFVSYLQDWRMFVEVEHCSNNVSNKIKSSLRSLKCGVPQGSILGPLLFLIYVNDLDINFPLVLFTLFADDTSITLHNKHLKDLKTEGENILGGVCDWFAANKLALNVDKTFNILFQPNRKVGELAIDTEEGSVSSQSRLKFLGVYIDESLDWKCHISTLNKSLSSAIYAIRIARQNIGRETALTIYYAYFYSLLQYGVEFWGISVDAKSTFILQKRAIRIIFSLQRLRSCREYFKDHKIFTLANLYIYKTAALMFGDRENLPTHAHIHRYSTRGNEAFLLPNFTLEVNRRSPCYMGTKILNHLPRHLLASQNEVIFKRNLKTLLHVHAFYNINEFFNHTF